MPLRSGTVTERIKWEPTVLAVVVTHERLPMLRVCIDRLRSQTYENDILVVDNNSGDGTAAWLEQQRDIAYIRQRNSGGAGGFHTGLKAGFQLGYDFVWVMDDDVAPADRCLEELVAVMRGDHDEQPIGWVCSKVTDDNGEMIALNHPVLVDRSIVVGVDAPRTLAAESTSFVSVAVTREAIAAVGLPYRQMFIWLDDVEYTRRITLSGFRGLLATKSIAVHHTGPGTTGRWASGLDRRSSWKYRHHFRNTALLMRTLSQGSAADFAYRFAQAAWRATLDLVRSRRARWLPFAWFWLVAGLFVSPRIDRADSDWEPLLGELT